MENCACHVSILSSWTRWTSPRCAHNPRDAPHASWCSCFGRGDRERRCSPRQTPLFPVWQQSEGGVQTMWILLQPNIIIVIIRSTCMLSWSYFLAEMGTVLPFSLSSLIQRRLIALNFRSLPSTSICLSTFDLKLAYTWSKKAFYTDLTSF